MNEITGFLGMRNGQGIETFYNGEKYVGTYVNDLQNGQVKSLKKQGLLVLILIYYPSLFLNVFFPSYFFNSFFLTSLF
jgi:hypothetical protein